MTLFDEVMEMLMSDPFMGVAAVPTRSASTVDALKPVRLIKEVCSSQFPPSNVGFNKKTKEMIIQVALAGLTEDNCLLELDNDDLILNVKVDPKEDEDIIFPQRGLKLATNEKISWHIDPLYYDRETIKTKFENGLLTITVEPLPTRRPKKLALMGNKNLLDKPKDEKKSSEEDD